MKKYEFRIKQTDIGSPLGQQLMQTVLTYMQEVTDQGWEVVSHTFVLTYPDDINHGINIQGYYSIVSRREVKC